LDISLKTCGSCGNCVGTPGMDLETGLCRAVPPDLVVARISGQSVGTMSGFRPVARALPACAEFTEDVLDVGPCGSCRWCAYVAGSDVTKGQCRGAPPKQFMTMVPAQYVAVNRSSQGCRRFVQDQEVSSEAVVSPASPEVICN
jgi:hypothetical protein